MRWESGLPYSEIVTVKSFYGDSAEQISYAIPQLRDRYVNGKRNAHRNPGYWTLDARLAREFNLSGKGVFGVTVEGFNLLNDDTLRIVEVRDATVHGVRRFGRRWQIGLRASF